MRKDIYEWNFEEEGKHYYVCVDNRKGEHIIQVNGEERYRNKFWINDFFAFYDLPFILEGDKKAVITSSPISIPELSRDGKFIESTLKTPHFWAYKTPRFFFINLILSLIEQLVVIILPILLCPRDPFFWLFNILVAVSLSLFPYLALIFSSHSTLDNRRDLHFFLCFTGVFFVIMNHLIFGCALSNIFVTAGY